MTELCEKLSGEISCENVEWVVRQYVQANMVAMGYPDKHLLLTYEGAFFLREAKVKYSDEKEGDDK